MKTKKSTISIVLTSLVLLLAGGLVSTSAQTASPNSIVLEYFTAVALYGQAGQIQVDWKTTSEVDTAGYFVMRATSAGGPYQQANASLILGQGDDLVGATYSYLDAGLEGGVTYYYYLRELQLGGGMNDHNDLIASATAWDGIFLPMVTRQ